MAKVRVEPIGLDLEVGGEETVFSAARRQGLVWPTVCGGHANCKACTMEVRHHPDALSPMSGLERRELLLTFGSTDRADAQLRLACQTKVATDGAIVFKRGVKPAEDPLRSTTRTP